MKKKASKARAPKPTKRGKKLPKMTRVNPGKDFDKPVRKTLKQPRLPGMEDSAIQELEDKAREFAEMRDEIAESRKALAVLEDQLVELMKKHEKDQYFHAGVLIKIKETSERVNARLNASKDPDAAEEPAPAAEVDVDTPEEIDEE